MIEVKVKRATGTFALDASLKDEGNVCLSGLNGSGKSSLLNVIAGVYAPDFGYVRLSGKDVTKLPMEQRGVVLVTPDSYIPHMEVDRHLVWGATLTNKPIAAEKVASVKDALGINYLGRIDKLSLGMRERVSLATAILSGRRTLLIDEAFSNIDGKQEFVRTFLGLAKKKGIDLIFTTQSETEASPADHHYMMKDGLSSRIF